MPGISFFILGFFFKIMYVFFFFLALVVVLLKFRAVYGLQAFYFIITDLFASGSKNQISFFKL